MDASIHDLINSGVLFLLVIAFFIQNNFLRYMKTAMSAIDPVKIKQAQELFEKGNEYKAHIWVSEQSKIMNKSMAEQYNSMNEDVLAKHSEFIGIYFNSLAKMSWSDRKKVLVTIPQNAPHLQSLLHAYDKGEHPFEDKSKESQP